VENAEERLNAILETLGNLRNEENNEEITTLERERIPEVEALFSVSPQPLALAFMEERPQTAAMLLAEFPRGQRHEILAFIPTNSRLMIESRLTTCGTPDTDILREAALAIQEHLEDFNLENMASRVGDGTGNTLEEGEREIVSLKPRTVMSPIRPLAEVLRHENREKTENMTESGTDSCVRTVMRMGAESDTKTDVRTRTEAVMGSETDKETLFFRFEDLKRLSEEDLRSFLMVCPQSDALLAFLGAETTLVERVLRILPKSEAAQVRQQLKNPGRIRLLDVEHARLRLLRLAQNLAKQGKLPTLELVEV
ncbi:MAG: FliG C-terminal domain-containing protein, partial [Planctomycetia bacterium]|nr:FliG C-terminal domain-containing protein [Planctomycetia bacterium]